jgi:photosystem II stability/assembly factor-like uncharacterized protein
MSIRIRDRLRRVLALLIPALWMGFNLHGASASDPTSQKAAPGHVIAARYEIKGRHRTDKRISVEDTTPSPNYTVSFDGGVTWAAADSGLPPLGLVGVGVRPVIDPTNPEVQYVSIESSQTGVYKTLDGGKSWTQLTSGLPASDLNPPPGPTELPVWAPVSIAIVPQDPSTVYVGISAAAESGLGGLYKSADAGGSFTRISTIPNGWFTTIDPHTPSIMYAASGSGFIESVDSGATWTLMTNGLPRGVTAIAVDQQPKLYVGTGSGIYQSTDRAQHWTPCETDLVVHDIVIDPNRSSIVYAVGQLDDVSALSDQGHGNPRRRVAQSLPLTGVIKSGDGGQTWGSVNGGLPMFVPALYLLAVDPLNSDILYLGTSNLTFKSPDGGESWNSFGSGWFPTNVLTLVADPKTEGTVYAGGMGFDIGPQVQGASLSGKQLIVTGQTFRPGAEIMLNGNPIPTLSDPENSDSIVYSAKGAKRIHPGTTVEIRVMNPDGIESNAYMFARPSN